jgi:hypothetical protein
MRWNKECGIRTFCYPNVTQNWKQIWNVKLDGAEGHHEICWAMKFHPCIIGVLGYMVKDPPLPPGADATPENIRKWKDWWLANQDRAQFVMKPGPNFE